MPIDPQRPGQPGQGWTLLVGMVLCVVIVVLIAVWGAHHG